MPNYEFVVNQDESDDHLIKVIGIGGGGSHAVRNMFAEGIRGVSYLVINTDQQALKSNPITDKLQIGANLTRGRGAGSDAGKGRAAAIESQEDIRKAIEGGNTAMVFITAGMGGGTGTGASPVVASIAKGLNMLTVGIVTLPFSFEGAPKMERAFRGIRELKEYCDTVLVILNDRVVDVYGDCTTREAMRRADTVLFNAAKCIAELITVEGHPNIDFNDVETAMRDSKTAIMGTGTAEGPDAAILAAHQALDSPLLNTFNISGARSLLVGIYHGTNEPSISVLNRMAEEVQAKAEYKAELKYSSFYDPTLGDKTTVTIIATGFNDDDPYYGYNLEPEMKKRIEAAGIPDMANHGQFFHNQHGMPYNRPEQFQQPQQPQRPMYQQPPMEPRYVTGQYGYEQPQQPPVSQVVPTQLPQQAQPPQPLPVSGQPQPQRTVIQQPMQQPVQQPLQQPVQQQPNAGQQVTPRTVPAQQVQPQQPEPRQQPRPEPAKPQPVVYDLDGNISMPFGVDATQSDQDQTVKFTSPEDQRERFMKQAEELRERNKKIQEAISKGVDGLTPQVMDMLNEPAFTRSEAYFPDNRMPAMGTTAVDQDNLLSKQNSFLNPNKD